MQPARVTCRLKCRNRPVSGVLQSGIRSDLHNRPTDLESRGVCCTALGDKFRELGDKFREFENKVKFENWAPKSSRAWRLRQTPNFDEANKEEADFSNSLDKRLREMSGDSQSSAQPADKTVGSDASETAGDATDLSRESFSDAGDDDIAKALASRLGDGTPAADEASNDVNAGEPEQEEYLEAEELVDLIVGKYGKKYDLTIARRSFAGKDFVSLNVMWVHVDQRSFPMSLEQYMDKMDGISVLMNAWNRQSQVRAFFKEKPKSKAGMPARPIVGQAVPLQLDLPPEQVQEWIGSRLG